jgi:hypothetical protein
MSQTGGQNCVLGGRVDQFQGEGVGITDLGDPCDIDHATRCRAGGVLRIKAEGEGESADNEVDWIVSPLDENIVCMVVTYVSFANILDRECKEGGAARGERGGNFGSWGKRATCNWLLRFGLGAES